jgi:hypothetical protein
MLSLPNDETGVTASSNGFHATTVAHTVLVLMLESWRLLVVLLLE